MKILRLLTPILALLLIITFHQSNAGLENDGIPIADHYEGGKDSLLADIHKVLKYPPTAKRNRIQGTCIIHLTMEEDGTFTDVKIVKEIGGGCGKAALDAIHAIKTSEKWNFPGYKANYQIPVHFKL